MRREANAGLPLFAPRPKSPPPPTPPPGGGGDPPAFGTFLGKPVLSEDQWKRLPKGKGRCPNCGQPTTDRARSITAKMLGFLVTLTSGDVKHIRRSHREEPGDGEMGGDYAKLPFWTLTESVRRGFWAITGIGLAWLRGEVKVPAKAGVSEWKSTDKLICFIGPWITPYEVPKAPTDVLEILRSGKGGLKP